MRRVLFFLVLGIWVTGCNYMGNYYDNQLYDDQLIEVDSQLVSGCALVGVISENADAGNPFPYMATRDMIYKVKTRAVKLGATHLVWLHKTKLAGTAEAYRCPSP